MQTSYLTRYRIDEISAFRIYWQGIRPISYLPKINKEIRDEANLKVRNSYKYMDVLYRTMPDQVWNRIFRNKGKRYDISEDFLKTPGSFNGSLVSTGWEIIQLRHTKADYLYELTIEVNTTPKDMFKWFDEIFDLPEGVKG